MHLLQSLMPNKTGPSEGLDGITTPIRFMRIRNFAFSLSKTLKSFAKLLFWQCFPRHTKTLKSWLISHEKQ